jgi:SOS-response transcriptional repressor LexA
MENAKDLAAKRLKKIRQAFDLTQKDFGNQLGWHTSTADLERGKIKIPGIVITNLLDKFSINPLWVYGKSDQMYLNLHKHQVNPSVISVNSSDEENILMVNQKAAAGYPHNIQDRQFYDNLPAFDMPLPEFRNATYRGFQVEGDSMTPDFEEGDWVLARSVESIEDVKPANVYVIVLYDSLLLKKIKPSQSSHQILLISINDDYPPAVIDKPDIQEIWEVRSKLTFSINDSSKNSVLKKLERSMEELKDQLLLNAKRA